MASGSSSAGGSSAGGVGGSGGSSGCRSGSGTFDCDVCAETVKGNALPCAHCAFSCCGECAKRYWADRPFDSPACMSCRKALTVQNLELCFSKTYVKNGMEAARRTALFEAEKTLFLQTQEVLFPVVHAYEAQLAVVEDLRLKLRSLEQQRLDVMVSVADLQREFVRTGNDKACPVFREWVDTRARVPDLDTGVDTAWRALRSAADTANALRRYLTDYSLDETTTSFHRYVTRHSRLLPVGVTQRVLGAAPTATVAEAAAGPEDAAPAAPKEPKRIAPCTRAGCLGMYSSETGVCMVCSAEHCTKCAKMLDASNPAESQPAEETVAFAVTGAAFSVTVDAEPSSAPKKKAARHKCDPNDVATAKYLATTTKPCPRCHTAIQRESGCAQMLCTKCHTVFNWNTLKEETGVIHNPHFYQLSTEMRQRIVDERAARGIAAGREARFLAGVGPRGGCDANAEHDPLCVEFTAPVFLRLMERALKDDSALLRDAMDVHRHAVHCAQVELPGIENMLGNANRFGEQRTRHMRLAYLNGGKYVKELEELSSPAHPLKFRSNVLVVVDGEKPLTLELFKRHLMRIDTERTKLVKKAELLRTFTAAAEDALRLALASTPGELKALVRSAVEMRATMKRELTELNGGVGHKRGREGEGAAVERLAPVPPAPAAVAPPVRVAAPPVRVAAPPVRVVVAQPPVPAAAAAAGPAAAQMAAAIFGDNDDSEDMSDDYSGSEEMIDDDDGSDSDSEPF